MSFESILVSFTKRQTIDSRAFFMVVFDYMMNLTLSPWNSKKVCV